MSSEEKARYIPPSSSVSTSKKFRYPCTGRTEMEGFHRYIAAELGESRRNLRLFSEELTEKFGWPRISLTNSGSSANLAAALTIAEKCREQDGHSPADSYGWLAAGETAPKLGEVIVAGFTFPSTMSGLLTAGFDLKVVDTEEGGFNLCPEALRKAINENTRGICVTHWLGFPAQMDVIMDIAHNNKAGRRLFVMQDACESMELEVKGRAASEYGDISTWSFYHPHHMSSFGGGAVSSPHDTWQQVTESFTHWGRACTCHFNPSICEAPPGMHHNFWYVRVGHNLEMSELNACFGRYQLANWEDMEARRTQHYATLYNALSDLQAVTVHPQKVGCGSPFVFPIVFHDSAVMKAALGEMEDVGIEFRNLMGGVVTQHPVYSSVPTEQLDNCNATSQNSIFVGVHQTLKRENVEAVADHLRRILGTHQ